MTAPHTFALAIVIIIAATVCAQQALSRYLLRRQLSEIAKRELKRYVKLRLLIGDPTFEGMKTEPEFKETEG